MNNINSPNFGKNEPTKTDLTQVDKTVTGNDGRSYHLIIKNLPSGQYIDSLTLKDFKDIIDNILLMVHPSSQKENFNITITKDTMGHSNLINLTHLTHHLRNNAKDQDQVSFFLEPNPRGQENINENYYKAPSNTGIPQSSAEKPSSAGPSKAPSDRFSSAKKLLDNVASYAKNIPQSIADDHALTIEKFTNTVKGYAGAFKQFINEKLETESKKAERLAKLEQEHREADLYGIIYLPTDPIQRAKALEEGKLKYLISFCDQQLNSGDRLRNSRFLSLNNDIFKNLDSLAYIETIGTALKTLKKLIKDQSISSHDFVEAYKSLKISLMDEREKLERENRDAKL